MADEKTYTVIIPKEVEPSGLLTCLIDPPTFEPEFSLTLKGEDTPFQSGKIEKRRVNEVSVFMFRPKTLNSEKTGFTEKLKAGDEVTVKIKITENNTVQEEEGTVTII